MQRASMICIAVVLCLVAMSSNRPVFEKAIWMGTVVLILGAVFRLRAQTRYSRLTEAIDLPRSRGVLLQDFSLLFLLAAPFSYWWLQSPKLPFQQRVADRGLLIAQPDPAWQDSQLQVTEFDFRSQKRGADFKELQSQTSKVPLNGERVRWGDWAFMVQSMPEVFEFSSMCPADTELTLGIRSVVKESTLPPPAVAFAPPDSAGPFDPSRGITTPQHITSSNSYYWLGRSSPNTALAIPESRFGTIACDMDKIEREGSDLFLQEPTLVSANSNGLPTIRSKELLVDASNIEMVRHELLRHRREFYRTPPFRIAFQSDGSTSNRVEYFQRVSMRTLLKYLCLILSSLAAISIARHWRLRES